MSGPAAGPERVHRTGNTAWGPALLRRLGTDVVRRCAFYDHHTAPHSWDVDEACGLFVGHPAGHGWEVWDPTDEAIAGDLAKRHPHLFPRS